MNVLLEGRTVTRLYRIIAECVDNYGFIATDRDGVLQIFGVPGRHLKASKYASFRDTQRISHQLSHQ